MHDSSLDWVWKLDPVVREAELRARGYQPVTEIDWPEVDLSPPLGVIVARVEQPTEDVRELMRRYVAASGGRMMVLGEGSVAEDIPVTRPQAPRIPSKGETPTNSRRAWRRWMRRYKADTRRIARGKRPKYEHEREPVTRTSSTGPK